MLDYENKISIEKNYRICGNGRQAGCVSEQAIAAHAFARSATHRCVEGLLRTKKAPQAGQRAGLRSFGVVGGAKSARA